MKRAMIGGICLLVSTLPANATPWAAQIVGEILAYASFCKAVEVDFVAMEYWARQRGVSVEQFKTRVGPDFRALNFGNEVAREKLADMSVGDVCAEAIRLYGPSGINVSGMVKLK